MRPKELGAARAEADGSHSPCHDIFVVALALAISAAYATLRYNVFKGVAWSDWPHYIGNKALALAALVLVALAVLRLVRRRPRPIRHLMAAASGLAITHSFVSLGLFEPAYFDKFFDGDKLTLTAGISLMLASLSVAMLQWGKGRKGSGAPENAATLLGVIAFFSGAHAALPSTASWFEPANWPGNLPPITLLSFLVGSAALAVTISPLLRRRAAAGGGGP